jgi:hypothetical protein
MGTKGGEFGQFGDQTGSGGQQGQSGTAQSDLGSQSDTTLAGRSDQQDLGTDQPGSVGGASGSGSEGFIGSQGSGSEDLIEGQASSSEATGGSDFAAQGRGATEGDNEDVEGDQSRGSDDSDVEQP